MAAQNTLAIRSCDKAVCAYLVAKFLQDTEN